MRFKKGDKVEVMNNKDLPVSWHIAEVVSGSSHTYHVHYDSYPGMGNDKPVAKVPLKFVRPCPPLAQGLENCYTGDIVEVFHENSWKLVAILKIMDKKEWTMRNEIHMHNEVFEKRYLVRLLGSSHELVVGRWNMRMRQTWHDGKWIMMGKSCEAGKDAVANKPSTLNCYRKLNLQVPQFNARIKYQPEKYYKDILDDAVLGESPVASSRSMKRVSPYSTIVEAQHGHAQKLRAIEKEGQKQRVAPEKVDAFAYPKDILGEKSMHAYRNNIISNGYNQMERTNQNDVNNSNSDACSVGSCSIMKQSSKNYYGCFRPTNCQETDSSCSDAESCCALEPVRESSSPPPKEGFEVSIRKLELHAYRSTLEALYASGPLSWDREELLTNLRTMLHISNDEHLQELRHLLSPKTTIGVR